MSTAVRSRRSPRRPDRLFTDLDGYCFVHATVAAIRPWDGGASGTQPCIGSAESSGACIACGGWIEVDDPVGAAIVELRDLTSADGQQFPPMELPWAMHWTCRPTPSARRGRTEQPSRGRHALVGWLRRRWAQQGSNL